MLLSFELHKRMITALPASGSQCLGRCFLLLALCGGRDAALLDGKGFHAGHFVGPSSEAEMDEMSRVVV